MPSDKAMKDPPSSDKSKKKKRKKKRRWGDAAPEAAAAAPAVDAAADARARALALQDSIKAKLAALKGSKQPAAANKRASSDAASQPKAKKARVFELDMSVTGPTFERMTKTAGEKDEKEDKPASAPPKKKKVNPYLAHVEADEAAAAAANDGSAPDGDGDAAVDPDIIDDRLVRSGKQRQRGKALSFVQPGTFVEIAERKRQKAANAVQSGFASGRKVGTYYTSATMAEIYGGGGGTAGKDVAEATVAPEPPESSDKTSIPSILEWWDVELLPSRLKKKVAAFEGKALSKQTQSQMTQFGDDVDESKDKAMDKEAKNLQDVCFSEAALSHCKTAGLVQHIVPIKPPHAKDGPEAQPTLYLTKKERKRQRKMRREEKQREQQDMQAAGLIPAPEPRLTLRNFMKVLGDQAYLDPSQMEQKVREQIEARQRAHVERNDANKLTKDQRKQKRAQKLLEDTKGEVHVALFYVKDMSHPYHRAKVELNAQQYNISGGVLECENPKMACVICEGGPKSIKKYRRLMTVRMKWLGLEEDESDDDDDEEEEDEEAQPQDPDAPVRHKFNKDNKCELVWTGLAVRHHFKGFVFQSCDTSEQARKILQAKGVGHMWDQVLACASGTGDGLQLKLGVSDNEGDDDMDVE